MIRDSECRDESDDLHLAMRAIYQLIGNNVKTCFKINSMYESKFGILCMNQNSVAKLSHGFSSFVTLYKYLMSKKVYHHSFVAM